MKILTREQSQQLDRIAIDKMGIPSIDLMGKAGSAVANYALKAIADIHNPSIAIFCGRGNNAGDGYKAALDLKLQGLNPLIINIFDENEIKGDSFHFYKQCIDSYVEIVKFADLQNKNFNLIIDAILGTGFKGDLHAPISQITKWINQQESFTLSVDIPSGISAVNGAISENAVNADTTVTMGMIKFGMMIEPARSFCGEIITADIGFPNIYNDLEGLKIRIYDDNIAKTYLSPPKKDTYKYRQGKVLLITGSTGLTGAGILAANAAIRSGAGLVKVCVPQSLNNIYESNIIEGMTIACQDDEIGYLRVDNYIEIEKYFKWADCLVIGPGLGLNDSTKNLVKKIIMKIDKPIVIDADAFNVLYDDISILQDISNEFVITPHQGEFSNLLNISKGDIQKNLIDHIQLFMNDINGTLVLKNAPTLIATGNDLVINTSGNQGMATGGTGDVLSGIIGSLIAQGINAKDAAELGVYIHGQAADLAIQTKGFRGLIASDIIEYIPTVIMGYET